MSATKILHILRSSSWFVLANAFAGGLNYLYQVLASRELSAAEYANLNAWFANLAIFFLIGGVLQYAANFIPLSQIKTRSAIFLINLICLGLAAAWILGPEGETFARALIVLTGAALFGWMVGQVQSRMLFLAMTVASLLVGASKIALVLTSTFGATLLERYTFALFACYLPALWWMSFKVWNQPAPQLPRKNVWSWSLWAAPVILSTASAVIPQMDMILMNRIQPAAEFQDFARASLFYKCIYFLMYIVAQWLLPQQIQSGNSAKQKHSWYAFAAASLLASAALAATSPLAVQWVMHWDHTPPISMIFLSCLNISLLTWVFFEIQASVSRHHLRGPALALVALGVEAALQLALCLTPNLYLLTACAAQAILIAFLRL